MVGEFLYGSDCSKLIPPCWQEFHYLYAGIMIGVPLGMWIGVKLYVRWTRKGAHLRDELEDVD